MWCSAESCVTAATASLTVWFPAGELTVEYCEAHLKERCNMAFNLYDFHVIPA
jgi:hypothetical protein